jgi:two-component system phosphate regulon sensor histidine kinase PhoR
MRIRLGLGWKIFLVFLLVLVASGFFVWFYDSVNLQASYEQDQEQSLTRETKLAAQLIQLLPMRLVQEQGDQLAGQLATSGEVRFTLIDGLGKVLGDSAEPAALLPNHADRPEVRDAIQGKVGIYRRYSITLGESTLYVAVPVPALPPVELVVRASVPSTFLDGYLRSLLNALLVALAGGFLISLLLVPWVSYLVTHPVRRMVDGLKPLPQRPRPLLRMERGDELGLLARSIDTLIAQGNRQDEQLSALEEKLQAFQTQERDGVLLMDADQRVLSASPQALAMLGLPERRLLGKSLLESTLDHALVGAMSRALEGQHPVSVTFNGRSLLLRGVPLDSSTPDRSILWLEDRSELVALQGMRRDFIANVSHELKTPIASLRAMLETLTQNPPPPPPLQGEFLCQSVRETEYLQYLLESLSKLSSLEQGTAELQLIPVDLRTFLFDLANGLSERARKQSVQIDVKAGEVPIMVEADPIFLREAFLAILDNALKFAPLETTVSISAVGREGWATLQFRDQGPGIPAEEVPRIFERFYKVDKGRSSKGFGIGLSLAKHIVERFSGNLHAFSDLGKGALFVIRLPLLKQLSNSSVFRATDPLTPTLSPGEKEG